MSESRINRRSSINTGAISVSTAPFSEGTKLEANGTKTGDFTFPAGAYKAVIHVLTFGGSITVNGDEFTYGESTYQEEYGIDQVNQIQDFLPSLVVTADAGTQWNYYLCYPSSSGVNVNNL